MIDARFSKEAFEALGWNSEESRNLCAQLDSEIHSMLVVLLKPAMKSIVERLNLMGHALLDVSEEMGDDMHYREPLLGEKNSGRYKMLLAADLVITAGYPKSQR